MQMAISAYKNQKIKSKSKAAEIFGVPKSTLYKQLSGVKLHPETRANGYRMIVIKEKSLIKHLLDVDKQGFLIQPEFLHGMAHILL
jgi:predicted transcriptional regulator